MSPTLCQHPICTPQGLTPLQSAYPFHSSQRQGLQKPTTALAEEDTSMPKAELPPLSGSTRGLGPLSGTNRSACALLLLTYRSRSCSNGRHGLAGRSSRRGPCFFVNAKVPIEHSSANWVVVMLPPQKLLLRLALFLACETVAATGAASEHLGYSTCRLLG